MFKPKKDDDDSGAAASDSQLQCLTGRIQQVCGFDEELMDNMYVVTVETYDKDPTDDKQLARSIRESALRPRPTITMLTRRSGAATAS